MFEIIKERVINHKGLRLKPYRCSGNKLSIGYGRNLEDCGISQKEAEYLLENDLRNSHKECIRSFWWYPEMPSIRQGVILEMCFNLGLTRLKTFKKMISACELKNYELVSQEMLNSLWARQVGERAKTLANIMKKGA